MELTEPVKRFLMDTADSLKGHARRVFMARAVRDLGIGQRQACRELGWNRDTLRKGTRELESGVECLEAFSSRGRKSAEHHLPRLLDDLRDLVDSQSQIDPRFESERLYRRLSAKEIRRQLIEKKKYTDEELPSVRTIREKLNQLGYHPAKVAKCQPKKRSRKPMPSLTS
jgi:hypothetical protein